MKTNKHSPPQLISFLSLTDDVVKEMFAGEKDEEKKGKEEEEKNRPKRPTDKSFLIK